MATAKTPLNVHFSRFTCALHDEAKGHFIPHEKNDYVPHVLRHRVLAAYSAIFVLLKVLLVLGYAALPAASVYSSALTADNIVRLTNLARVAAGLPELTVNGLLTAAAEHKAGDMAAKEYFAHTSPEGRTPWSWIREAGYSYKHAGENLAVHYTDAEGVHSGWMASPTHRQNIVDPRYEEIGVGVQSGRYKGFDTIFVVQMFGVQKTALAAGESTAEAPAPAPTTPGLPTIDDASVAVIPEGNGYAVEAKIENASVAEAYVGATIAPLTKGEDDVWRGRVEAAEVTSPEPQHLFVGAANEDGVRVAQSVATVAPNAEATDLFIAGGRSSGSFKLFGLFEVRNLEDGVQRFYLYSIGFLLAALALKVFITLEVQRHSVILHTVAVVGLAGVLLVL